MLFYFGLGVLPELQPVRAKKTQIKSRPISAANGNPGSLPADSFRKTHLAFDVLQVWSSLFKEPMQWALVEAHITALLLTPHQWCIVSQFHFCLVLAICLPTAWAAVGFYTWLDESVNLELGTSWLLLRICSPITFSVHTSVAFFMFN